jgi:hypothetical protein
MDNNIYIVKHSDLIGQISDFPIEVVQKMVERQYAQNGSCDVSVFQRNKDAGFNGFCWANTPEGDLFWRQIINNKRWHIFFDEYPILQNNCVFVVVDGGGKYLADVQRMQQFCEDGRKFAYKNKVGDIYYIDVDRHNDRQVRFALANSPIAKEVIEKGVKFGDATTPVDAEQKLDGALKSKDASDAYLLDLLQRVAF